MSGTSSLDPAEAFSRAQSVLNHFGVPSEADPQGFFDDLQNKTSSAEILSVLKYFDARGAFKDFGRVPDSSQGSVDFSVFQDRKSNQILDYSVSLRQESAESSPASFEGNLTRASRNPEGRELEGLRIALDPGHMGGDYWDAETGKFVTDHRGHKLSEGLLNLQIALLLEKSFEDLGAKVMITHRSLAAVSSVPYSSFDLREYGLRTLRESVLDSWFQSLLSTAPAGSRLYDAFSSSRSFKKLFSESKRWSYFILGYDLEARANAMTEFSPDISLIIHLDTSDPPGDPSGVSPSRVDGTKAYVPGAFSLSEMSTREDRKYFGRHLLDTRVHQASIALSRAIVHQIHSQLGVPFAKADGTLAIEIEPGVHARNLEVQRKLTSHPTSYIESLFYNDPIEFAALIKTNHPMTIDGKNYPYSDRLDEIHRAIRDATVSFVKNYSN